MFPPNFIDKNIKDYHEAFTVTDLNNSNKSDETRYYKLPYVGVSRTAQSRVQRLTKKFCKEIKIKLVFSTYKINNMLNNAKDTIPREL